MAWWLTCAWRRPPAPPNGTPRCCCWRKPRARRPSAGTKGFDVPSVVAGVRALGVTPHVAQKVTGSAIDDRTTRHPGYAISQQKRKLIEQVFGWLKTVGGLRKLRHRGGERVDWVVTFAAAAYNLIRLRTLLARPAWAPRHVVRVTRGSPPRSPLGDKHAVASHFFIGLLV
jgi:hypothetical protein